MIPVLATIFATSFMIALSGALMPGPVLTVTISESARRGAVTGPLMMFGHGLLELALVLALLAGLAPFLTRDDVFVSVSLLGGVVLLWMAISMFRALPSLDVSFKEKEKGSRNLVFAGIVLSLANPYWLIWWATIGIGYIVYAMKYGPLGVMAFFAGHISADVLWYSFISFGVAKGKRFFSTSFYRRLIGSCALFLLCFSGYFFYSGVMKGIILYNNIM
jgi:threonine/homoserine/homoserine lactone efflux protein